MFINTWCYFQIYWPSFHWHSQEWAIRAHALPAYRDPTISHFNIIIWCLNLLKISYASALLCLYILAMPVQVFKWQVRLYLHLRYRLTGWFVRRKSCIHLVGSGEWDPIHSSQDLLTAQVRLFPYDACISTEADGIVLYDGHTAARRNQKYTKNKVSNYISGLSPLKSKNESSASAHFISTLL